MRKYFQITLATLLVLYSCSKSTKNNVINVSPAKADTLSIHEISANVSFKTLELTDYSIINDIFKYVVYNNNIFISDYDQKAIIVFDLNGNYKNRIGKYGQGPSEIIELSDFILDTLKKEILIWDNALHKCLLFTTEGEFIASKKTDLTCRNLIQVNKELYAIYSGYSGDYNISIVNNNLEIQQQYLLIDNSLKYLPIILNNEYFHKNQNGITFIPSFEPSIYTILRDGSIKKSYNLNFGENTIDEKYIQDFLKKSDSAKRTEKIYKLFFEKLPKSDFAYNYHSFKESETYIYFEYVYKSREMFALINKSKQFTYNIKHWAIDENKMIVLNSLNFLLLENKTLIGYFQISELLAKYSKLSDEQKKNIAIQNTTLNDLIMNSNSTDNPVIITIELK